LVPNRAVGTEISYALLHKGLLDKELADYRPIVIEAFDPGVLVFTKKKVTKIKELEGMKIRFAGATTKMALEALGATPVSIPGPELFAALNSGIVDGTTISPCYMVTSGTHEIMKYVVWGSSLFEGANIVLMSQKTWSSLPTDIQLIMEELSAKAKYDYLKRGQQHDIEALNTMKEVGMEIYRLEPDELKRMQEMMQVVEDQWVSDMEGAGLPGKEALATAKQVVERLKW
jgi:TRAP-type C4-dicarboxylate transport system substrate-binding protein